jgi:hypothetical protein
MAKQTALELVNRVLNRVGQDEVTDISALTARTHADRILQYLNEGQNLIYAEELEWYSLYKTRKWSTVTYQAATIAFNNANPDTITDSANGFGSFASGQQVLVSGSDSNDGTYTVQTAAAGTLTLQSADNLTAEAAGETVTITAITYAVPSDWARTYALLDTTNDTFLTPDDTVTFDEVDPDSSETATPTHYGLDADYIRIYPIPAGTYSLRERYYALPTAFTANTDTSLLPIETENCLIYWAWSQELGYLNKFDESDRIMGSYNRMLKIAQKANKKKINIIRQMHGSPPDTGIRGPRFPSSYGPNFRGRW